MTLGSEYIRESNGTWIVDTKHAIDRLKQRRGLTPQQIDEMLQGVLDYYTVNREKFEQMPYNSEVFFYSPKHKRGMIMSHRRDTKNRLPGMHWFLMTVYPQGSSTPVHKDTERFILN
jgi:hypothetical protein